MLKLYHGLRSLAVVSKTVRLRGSVQTARMGESLELVGGSGLVRIHLLAEAQ